MKEELIALQDLFKETLLKYGIKYANASFVNDHAWITIEDKYGRLIDVGCLEEEC